VATGTQRFVQQQIDRSARETTDLPTGKVTSTSPFTVLLNTGASLVSPHVRRLASYTPAVNDITMLVRSGGKWIALGPTV
jgi:hypothetical protein